VKTAPGGVVGLQILQQERFSAVFCDYNMPGMNGDELVSKFREWERINRVEEPIQAIYGLTGENTVAVFASCRKAGMQDVFLKPLKTSEALQALDFSCKEDLEVLIE
jgi:CheY-like chemotaxis protein